MSTIGLYVNSNPVGSIGDTLGLTAILPSLHSQGMTDINVVTLVPDLFYNNPYVSGVLNPLHSQSEIKIQACRQYDCNIVNHYANQLNLSTIDLQLQMYLTEDELLFGQTILKTFVSIKKIAVCLKSSADSRDLRYHKIEPLLKRLKDDGHILIALGNHEHEVSVFDLNLLNITTIRQAASIIKNCDLYLGVDTGLFHVAEAMNTPQVVFFRNLGCSNNKYTRTHFIDSVVKCGEKCYLPDTSKCYDLYNRCMDNFDLESYYKLIKKVLNT